MRGWLALNLVNAGSVSKLAVSLDSHSIFVYAGDGLFTALQEVKVNFSSLDILGQTDSSGALHGCRPTIFCNDQAEPTYWELLFAILHISVR